MRRKMIALGGSLAAASLLLTACGGGGGGGEQTASDLEGRYEPDASTPAWQLDTKEERTHITWYVNADWWNTEWGQDLVTAKIAEDLNIDVTFITGDDTRLNTMFAGGDVADIVTIFDMNSQVAMRAPTWARSLNELAETYDPYWFEVAAPETMDWFKMEDGQTYGYPNYSNTYESYEEGLIPGTTAFLIRKDVYDALGQPSFATPEEFNAALETISEQFPDLVPFGFNPVGSGVGSLGDIFQNFLGVPLQTDDGAFYNRNLDPSYLTWVEALREAHSNGNISDDSFADDQTTWEEKLQTGRYATILAGGLPQMGSFLQSWYTTHPESEYIAIDGPQNPNGHAPTLAQAGISGWMINYISQTAVDPAKCMQLFTYLQSEYGNILTTFGIEGETFQYDAEGKIELLPDVQAMREERPQQFQREYRLGEFILFGNDKWMSLASDKMRIPALIQPQNWGTPLLVPQFVLENTNPPQGTQAARNLSGIDTEWATTLVSMIRAGSPEQMNARLESYEAFLDANGWQEIVDIRTENMERNRETLGLS